MSLVRSTLIFENGQFIFSLSSDQVGLFTNKKPGIILTSASSEQYKCGADGHLM